MRFVQNKDPNSPPPSLEIARDEQNRIAVEADKGSIKEKVYKGEKIVIQDQNDPYYGEKEFEVRYILRILYNNKCAYCERTDYKPDVEHYRPKKRVTGHQRNNHGYYWLCYEWTNLIPACYTCNSRSGKWDKFPLLQNRVTAPPFNNNGSLDFSRCVASHQYLLSEQPAILHPEIDNPENYLILKWNGILASNDGSGGRGYHTIKTCDLNRGNLIIARKKIVDDYTEQLKASFVLFRNDHIQAVENLVEVLRMELHKIKERKKISNAFSFVSYYIWENFTDFVHDNLDVLDQNETDILLLLFNQLNSS